MKDEYIRQVQKALSIPNAKKKEVLRDLQEAFVSALEHGETEQAVIARLGSPVEFARNAQASLGIPQRHPGKAKRLAVAVFLLAAAVFWGLFLYVRLHRTPDSVIGQADTMTSIRVASTIPLDVSWLLAILGIVFLVAAGVMIIRAMRRKQRVKR